MFNILTDWADPVCMSSIGSSNYVFWWCAIAFGPLLLLLPFLIQGIHLHRTQQLSAAADNALPEERRILSYVEYKKRRRVAYWKKSAVQNILIIQTLTFMHGVSMALGIWHCKKDPEGNLRLLQHPSLQ